MKTIPFNPPPGTHIDTASRDAAALAREQRARVRFRFNGLALIASPKKSPATLVWEFTTEMDRQSRTLEGAAWRRMHEAWVETETIKRQDSIDRLIAMLPNIATGDLDTLMRWASAFAEDADWIGVHFNKGILACYLVGEGFAPNAHVGTGPEFLSTRKLMAEYIIGQFITCLMEGMPPHPITITFVERYFKLPK